MVVGLLSASAVLLVLLVIIERHVKHPMLNLSLYNVGDGSAGAVEQEADGY